MKSAFIKSAASIFVAVMLCTGAQYIAPGVNWRDWIVFYVAGVLWSWIDGAIKRDD